MRSLVYYLHPSGHPRHSRRDKEKKWKSTRNEWKKVNAKACVSFLNWTVLLFRLIFSFSQFRHTQYSITRCYHSIYIAHTRRSRLSAVSAILSMELSLFTNYIIGWFGEPDPQSGIETYYVSVKNSWTKYSVGRMPDFRMLQNYEGHPHIHSQMIANSSALHS